jgi:hypothetical protein
VGIHNLHEFKPGINAGHSPPEAAGKQRYF